MIGVCSVVMVGMLGLTIDMGRAYIAKNELQAFADAASIAAALKLDGTSTGLTNADAAGNTGPVGPSSLANGWYFAAQTVSSPAKPVQGSSSTATVTYSTLLNGTYNPKASADVASRFVHVLASGVVPMLFMPIVPGVASTITVNASATAGQQVKNGLIAGGANGLAPFAPYALNSADPNFGFTKGALYTLRGVPPGNMAACSGDAGQSFPNGPQDRGYIDVGQGNGNSALADPIVHDVTYGTTYYKGSVIPFVPGQKHVGPDIHDRFWQDTDKNQTITYSTYLTDTPPGNGRRILIVPVADPAQSGAAYVVGFAAFFLQNDFTSLYGNTDPLCGEYIGTATLDSTGSGGIPKSTPDTYYSVQLFR